MAHNRCLINVYKWHERGNWLSRIDCKELQSGNRSRQNKHLADSGRNKNPLLTLSRSNGSLCSLSWFSLLSGRTEGRQWLFPVGVLMSGHQGPLCLELGQKGYFQEKVRSACSQVTHTELRKALPTQDVMTTGSFLQLQLPAPRVGPAWFHHPSHITFGDPQIILKVGREWWIPGSSPLLFLSPLTPALFLMSPLPPHHQRDHERLKKIK